MNQNTRMLIQCLVNGDVTRAKSYAAIVLKNESTKKDAQFCTQMLRKLESKPNLIELPYNLQKLLVAEDSALFPVDKYFLRESDRTEAEQQKLSLSAELEKFVGKPMFTRQEKEPFIQVMDVGRKKTGDMSRSYSVLAAYLESKNLPYRLERYRTSRIDPDTGRKKNYNGVWKLNRI